MKVVIPAACFNPYQLNAATFVFRTLRVGFPTADVVIAIGNTEPVLRDAILETVQHSGIKVTCNDGYQTVPLVEVYRGFVERENEPLFFCDTDVIFWDSIESRMSEFADAVMAGRYLPRFYDRVTRCETMPRLHNCLLYVDPARFRRAVDDYYKSLGPESVYTPRPDLLRPTFTAVKNDTVPGAPATIESFFYDTWGVAYHALRETAAFSDSVNACFDHLTCGSIASYVGSEYGFDMAGMHRHLMSNPEKIRGLWKRQLANYQSRTRSAAS